MPISSTTPINNYTGNSSTTVFPYDFYIPLEADISVYFDGVIQASGFTVSGVGNSTGGDITFSVAPTTGVTVRLERVTTRDRTTDYSEGGGLAADTLDADLDRVVAIVQEIDRATIQEDSDGKIDAVTRVIKNVVDPVSDQDVATKAYADTQAVLTAADLVLTNADVVLTGIDVGLTNADVVSTNADVVLTNADVVLTNADVVSAAAEVVLAQAEVVLAAAEVTNAQTEVTYADEWATKAEDSLISVAAGGDGSTDYSALHHAAKAAASAAPNEDIYTNIQSRNCLITTDPLSQAGSSTAGISSTIYTGNGTSQSITSGVDMSTGDLGGLVWVKGRSGATSHKFIDSVRGATIRLSSNATNAEVTEATGITSFDTTGFSLGADGDYNTNTSTYASWSFQTNQKKTGTTNRNKAYTAHYNADMGFSIVGYEGDGVTGHEIPHHLGVIPELTIIKNRDTADSWLVGSSLFGLGDYLALDTTAAITNAATREIIFSDTTINLKGTSNEINQSASNIISYNFTSTPNVSKVGTYIGTSAAGNYVSCGFKPSFVMIKELTGTGSWVIQDSIRGDNMIYADTSGAEAASSTQDIDFTDDGFVCTSTGGHVNATNSEYIFLAFAETSNDATKAIANYTKPTNADQLAITNPTTMSFANGFNATGQVDTQEDIAGGTLTFGTGYEDSKYYIYRTKDTAWGFSEVRPLTGLTRNDADKSGVVSPSDSTLRTTAKHFDYESETGVALASGEAAGYEAYHGFNKDLNDILATTNARWLVASITTSWLQYKHTERRILNSWRMRNSSAARMPKRFTIEGSQDGYSWTAIDSTYTSSDYTGNGAELWGDLQDTSANTTAYLYHRINITANSGDATYTSIAELELNTKIAADYYLEPEGKMYNDAGTRLDVVYVGECTTDASGNVSNFTNYSSGKKVFNEAEFLGKAVFHDEVLNKAFATAWVNFDGTQNPPLILDSFNVKDIVDTGTGTYTVIFETPMDTIGYTATIASINNSSNYTRGVGSYIDVNTPPTKKDFTAILCYGADASSSGSLMDTTFTCINIFGGKEIKGGAE